MAVRRRLVRPDAVLETQHGDVPYVTDQAYLEAVVAAAQTQALAGGVLSVIVDRTPTDLEHEMVTTAAVIEWRDRTDARPQPERSVPIEPTAPAIPQPGLFSETGEEETPAETAGLEEAATARDEHGFDYGQLEEEDVSSIPEAAR